MEMKQIGQKEKNWLNIPNSVTTGMDNKKSLINMFFLFSSVALIIQIIMSTPAILQMTPLSSSSTLHISF